MSDINDDLLNYELGDDIDDQDESIGNEDELLLSDEEISQQQEDLLLDDDDELLGRKKTPTIKQLPADIVLSEKQPSSEPVQPPEKIEAVTTTTKPINVAAQSPTNTVDSSCSSSSSSSASKIVAKESEVTTTNKPQKLVRPILKRNTIDPKKLTAPVQQQPPQPQSVPISVPKQIEPSTAETLPVESHISPAKPQIVPPPTEKQLSPERQCVSPQTSRTTDETLQPKNDEVSSTNTKDTETGVAGNEEENDEQIAEPSQTEPQVTNVVCDGVTATAEEPAVSSDDNVHCSQETVQSSSDNAKLDNSISQSQQSSSTTYDEGMYSTDDQYNQPEFETEDSDDSNERLNPKTCVEREEQLAEAEDANRLQQQHRQQFNRKHPMGRGGTFMGPRPGGQYPQHYNPFQTFSTNENFNPQHFRPGERPIVGPTGGIPPAGAHMMFRNASPFGGFAPQQFSMDMRPIRPMMRMPPNGPMPNNGPSYRPFNGNINMRPGVGAQIPPPLRYDNSRPRLTVSNAGGGQQFMPMRPAQFVRPGNMIQQQRPQQPSVQQQLLPILHGGPQSTGRITNTGPLMIPTKVLINPNFKGGVEAVTNKIMMESQFFAQNDAELLRKQEAFINQNRMHIEKRRFERSPDRERARERSYSPPPVRRRAYSREREPPQRRPYNNMYRGGGTTGGAGNNNTTTGGGMNRGRRAGSKDMDSRNAPKRRRSASLDREDDKLKPSMHVDQQEDEETRAYRQEIEKQKSMREKILRDKELRRRKAAAEIKKEVEEKKPVVDEPVSSQKFTPIIVTEKKIISLKKKSEPTGGSAASSNSGGVSSQQRHALPMAKIQPETKRTASDSTPLTALAIVKPVVKQTIAATVHHHDDTLDDFYDEDELLADSPPPPQQSTVNHPIAGKFTNRRVILKQSTAASGSSSLSPIETIFPHSLSDDPTVGRFGGSSSSNSSASTASAVKSKGIFERLDRRIGVNESAKRKIQRIVINNTD